MHDTEIFRLGSACPELLKSAQEFFDLFVELPPARSHETERLSILALNEDLYTAGLTQVPRRFRNREACREYVRVTVETLEDLNTLNAKIDSRELAKTWVQTLRRVEICARMEKILMPPEESLFETALSPFQASKSDLFRDTPPNDGPPFDELPESEQEFFNLITFTFAEWVPGLQALVNMAQRAELEELTLSTWEELFQRDLRIIEGCLKFSNLAAVIESYFGLLRELSEQLGGEEFEEELFGQTTIINFLETLQAAGLTNGEIPDSREDREQLLNLLQEVPNDLARAAVLAYCLDSFELGAAIATKAEEASRFRDALLTDYAEVLSDDEEGE